MKAVWEQVRRIGHALVWLLILSVPAGALLTVLVVSQPVGSELMAVAISLAILAGVIALGLCAVRRRWSLIWALVALFVLAGPFGVFVPFVVGLIGLGKLIIQAVGRGGMFEASELSAPIAEARPRGLVESVSHE